MQKARERRVPWKNLAASTTRRAFRPEVDYGQYRSTGELFESTTAKYRDRPAYTNMGRTISFGDLERMSRAFGAWLQAKGLAKGARVAVMMPNCLQYPACVFGILRAGYVVVNVNPLYTPRELEHQLKDSGAEAIVVLENFAHVLEQVIARTSVKHVVVAALGDLLGAKGVIVNFVVRHVKKMVPAWEIPGAVRFNTMLDGGKRSRAQARRGRPRGASRSSSTPGARPVCPRARCSRTGTFSPTSSSLRRG